MDSPTCIEHISQLELKDENCSLFTFTHSMVNYDKLAKDWPMNSDTLVMWLKLCALSVGGTNLLNVNACSHMLSA